MPNRTATASPASSEPSEATPSESATSASRYRAARPLPRELKEHCQIYLEEQIFNSALSFLNAVLSPGGSRQDGPPTAVHVPPASHLALIATLSVHPLHTTRATTPANQEVSAGAIRYLRNVLEAVGPINADFKSAFKFRDDLRRARGKRPKATPADDAELELPGDDRLRSVLALESSIWVRASDFWGVVGWAFNCCRLHPRRWRYWKAWLEFMADVMDADWDERERLGGGASKTHLRESIIASYINPDARRMGVLRTVKALLADGRQDHGVRFSEVFLNEPKRAKREKDLKAKLKVDIANDQFGDYYDDKEMLLDDEDPGEADAPPPIPEWKMSDAEIEAVQLRLRFFKLVSRAYYVLFDPLLTTLLYEVFTNDLRALPLQQFSYVITAHQTPLIQESLVAILTRLIHDLLPAARPPANPARVDPDTHAFGGISATILECCYLPFAASAARNDVRVSLILENMLSILHLNGQISPPSMRLQRAMEDGIGLRDDRSLARLAKTAARDAEADEAREILVASAERMRLLLSLACEEDG